MEAKLVVVGGNATKGEIRLRLPMTIGRTKEAGLCIAHPMVSRLHCTLYELDGAIVIRDNNSSNGTLVNGERISESVLRPGDKLAVGPLTFVAIYRHAGAFPSVGKPTKSDANGHDSVLHYHSEPGGSTLQRPTSSFHDLIDQIPDLDLNDPDLTGDLADQPTHYFGEDSNQGFSDAWDVLDEEAAEADESETGSASGTDHSSGDATDLSSFFKDLVDLAGDESMSVDDKGHYQDRNEDR
jgi:predicted component of type VI protein secretion system